MKLTSYMVRNFNQPSNVKSDRKGGKEMPFKSISFCTLFCLFFFSHVGKIKI